MVRNHKVGLQESIYDGTSAKHSNTCRTYDNMYVGANERDQRAP